MKLVICLFLAGFFCHSSWAFPFKATVTATEQPQVITANGRDGRDGSNGENAGHARCPDHTYTYNGDKGEDGENGEDGEDGGNILVYAKDLSLLKNLTLMSYGGDGGLGGEGGYGGAGCNGGYDGEQGEPGKRGSRGSTGVMYISAVPVAPDVLTRHLKLNDATQNSTRLHKNIWVQQSGAKALLNPSSHIAHYYYVLSEISELDVEIEWTPSKPASLYPDSSLQLKWNNEGPTVDLQFQGLDFAEVEKVQVENSIRFLIRDFFSEKELFPVSLSKSGKGRSERILVRDSLEIREVQTTYSVLIWQRESNWAGRYKHTVGIEPIDAKYITRVTDGSLSINWPSFYTEKLKKKYNKFFVSRHVDLLVDRNLRGQKIRKSFDVGVKF